MKRLNPRVWACGLLLSVILAVTAAGCLRGPQPSAPPQSELATVSGALRVHFIDVGQGDCILVQIPGPRTMLIDAGDSSNGQTAVRYLKATGIRAIDDLVVTHPHADHIGGMIDVLGAFDVGNVYMPRTTHSTATYEELLRAIKKKGLFITEARAGQGILRAANLDISFVAPHGKEYDDLNDWSAVVRIQYGDTVFLFMGDAGARAEEEMLLSPAVSPRANVLKVGHHGSGGSSSAIFLSAVSPQYAVISVGAGNPFGHPSKGTLARLADVKAQVYRTDIHGTVVIGSDGRRITVETERQE
ncbi:MAG: ComEC/Rec2 family competence protein [Ignavibacteriales bacterium]